jgi:CheY-like chemotaxis protein
MMDWLMPDIDGIETSRRIRAELKLTLPIILMTAFGKESEKRDAEKAGINAFLTKPVYQSTLFNTIMDVFGKEAMGIAGEKKAIITKGSVYKKRLRGIRILVAEDNPTNQEIALAILEGAGIVAEIAGNGREAVEAVRNRHFDAVLMDIQMPEMDGYEATRTIRKEAGLASLPIIAMTAHAMKGDEEKCLEAGMDGYVSKPIDQDRLFHRLWKLTKDHVRPSHVEVAEAEIPAVAKEDRLEKSAAELPDSLPGIKIQETLKALNIESNVYKRILLGFCRNNQNTMEQLRDAFQKRDRDKLLQLAHSLKGSAGNIGAAELSEASLELETAIRTERKTASWEILLDKVESTLRVVLKSLQSLAEPSEAHLSGIN